MAELVGGKEPQDNAVERLVTAAYVAALPGAERSDAAFVAALRAYRERLPHIDGPAAALAVAVILATFKAETQQPPGFW